MCPHKRKLRIPDQEHNFFSLETHELPPWPENEFKVCWCEVPIVKTLDHKHILYLSILWRDHNGEVPNE